jgi:hypothetical protein
MRLFDPKISKEIEVQLTTAMKNRLRDQGHVSSGKGLASLETKVIPKGDDLVIQILGEDYLQFQETGRKKGTMPNIRALERWVKRKGIASDMKEVKRIAFGIALNMKKVGMHSKGNKLDPSKRGFITQSIERKETIIEKKLFEMFEKNFELLVFNTSKEIEGKLKISL